MTLPNFFVIGAPKCGTTSLCRWLAAHPKVYFSPMKEPDYFSAESRKFDNMDAYSRLFDAAEDTHKAIGEGSTSYLLSKQAVPRIVATIDEPKFVVCIRNPCDMAYSLHNQRVLNGIEDVLDFKTAWRLCADLSASPRAVTRDERLDYKSACMLGSQLERVLSIVDRSQVQVVVLDDLKSDPRPTYLRLLAFLNLEDDGRTEFPVVNAAAVRRSHWLAQRDPTGTTSPTRRRS